MATITVTRVIVVLLIFPQRQEQVKDCDAREVYRDLPQDARGELGRAVWGVGYLLDYIQRNHNCQSAVYDTTIAL